MDQQPPSQSLNPYPAARDAPKPASIKVFGILNNVFGAMGFISSLAFFLVSIKGGPEPGHSHYSHSHSGGVDIPFEQYGFGFGGILSLVLIVCGVGLLRNRNWGRTGSLWYAAIIILFNVFSLVVIIAMAKDDESLMFIAGGAMCGSIMGIIYPIFILIFLTRPKVVEALKD